MITRDPGLKSLLLDLAWLKASFPFAAPLATGLETATKSVLTFLIPVTLGLRSVYDAVGTVLGYAQALAVLEVVHAALGLVRGSYQNALLQWLGRSHVLFLVLARLPSLQQTVAAGLLLLVWTCSEVRRRNRERINKYISRHIPRRMMTHLIHSLTSESSYRCYIPVICIYISRILYHPIRLLRLLPEI